MEKLEERLCPFCFQETMREGKCTACGYECERELDQNGHLPPFFILNTKYLLGKKLGQGGFGITYLAKNMKTGVRCCIKEYYPAKLIRERKPDGTIILKEDADPAEYLDGLQRFMEEAQTLQELRDNVSVVDVLERFEENGTAYFVMELIEGCNLRAFKREHTEQQTLKMALQMLLLIGSALAEVHRFGMIHGDISPENILISQDGEIKLIDFGAARSFRHGEPKQGQKIYLKPNYAPYEQYTIKPIQGPWTDIYALAATFYYIVSGQKMLDAMSRLKGQNYTPLYQLVPAISFELSAVIDRALAFDYHDRYRSMMEFLHALEKTVRPSDYNIDLGALMPKTHVIKVPPPESIHSDSSHSEEKEICAVSAQPEPRGLAAWFRRKSRKLAYLELTIDYKDSSHCVSRRRWMIEPNRVTMIGRSTTSNVLMPVDNGISREHCEITYNEKERSVVLKDVSKYGTYLANGARMDKGRLYTLKDGETFYVLSPKYMFRVVIET